MLGLTATEYTLLRDIVNPSATRLPSTEECVPLRRLLRTGRAVLRVCPCGEHAIAVPTHAGIQAMLIYEAIQPARPQARLLLSRLRLRRRRRFDAAA